MGRDKHISTETVNLTFFGQSCIFHIVPDNFPLPEEGIKGIKLFSKYRRYAITLKFLILDNIKLLFHEDGESIPGKTTKVFRIATTDQNQNVLVLDQENIPDGIYRIQNNEISVPITNYCIEPKPINTKIKYEQIQTINSRDVNSRKKEGKLWNRLQEIFKLSKRDHLDEHQKDIIQRLITRYQEVFSLDTEPLLCTNLTQHEIVVKSAKIINLRSHKLPEKHREYSLRETEILLGKGIIRESQSLFNSPLRIVPKKR